MFTASKLTYLKTIVKYLNAFFNVSSNRKIVKSEEKRIRFLCVLVFTVKNLTVKPQRIHSIRRSSGNLGSLKFYWWPVTDILILININFSFANADCTFFFFFLGKLKFWSYWELTLSKHLLKKQPPSALFPYILYIDLIRIAIHNNTHIHMYITNGKPFHIYRYIYCIHLGQIVRLFPIRRWHQRPIPSSSPSTWSPFTRADRL